MAIESNATAEAGLPPEVSLRGPLAFTISCR